MLVRYRYGLSPPEGLPRCYICPYCGNNFLDKPACEHVAVVELDVRYREEPGPDGELTGQPFRAWIEC